MGKIFNQSLPVALGIVIGVTALGVVGAVISGVKQMTE